MKINGNLSFLGLGQIQNLRVENLAVDPVSPSNGQVWYNTEDKVYRGFNGTDTITFATGGSTGLLQAEIDAIETAVGLAADGTFVPFAGTNNLDAATTVIGALTALDNAGKATADAATAAVAAEKVRAEAVEAGLAADIVTATEAAAAADLVLTEAVAAEKARAEAAEVVLTDAIAAEKARAEAAEAALAASIVTAGEGVATEKARAEAAEAALAASVTAEATRATDAETALSDRVTTEVADRTAADQALADALALELDLRFAGDTTLQANIDAEAAARAAADAALSAKLDDKLAGLTWENAVDKVVADITLVDLVGVADGTRIVDTATHTIFTVTGEALDAGEVLVEGAAFFDKETDVPYVFNGTALTQFNGAGSINAGTGLVKDGNTLSIVSTSGTITVTEDSIDVAQAVLDSITNVASNLAGEILVARSNEAGLSDRIDDEIAAREAADTAMTASYEAAVLAEKTRAEAAEVALAASIVTAGEGVATEKARAEAAELVLTDAIAAEKARAEAAELVLTDAGTAEKARAEAAELVLTDAVAAEVARATAAEEALVADLATEVAAREAGDAATNGRIEGGFFVYDGTVAATSHSVIHNIGSKYNNVTVVDADDEVVIPQSVKFTDATTLVVTFNTAIVCKVIVSGLKPLALPAV
jgi:hypothetical protein